MRGCLPVRGDAVPELEGVACGGDAHGGVVVFDQHGERQRDLGAGPKLARGLAEHGQSLRRGEPVRRAEVDDGVLASRDGGTRVGRLQARAGRA